MTVIRRRAFNSDFETLPSAQTSQGPPLRECVGQETRFTRVESESLTMEPEPSSFGFTYALVDPPALNAPEPSTWAMILIGFAGLGVAGYLASRKTAALAA